MIYTGETVSIDWLVTGHGTPFRVFSGGDSATATALEAAGCGPGWSAYLLLAPGDQALVTVHQVRREMGPDGMAVCYQEIGLWANLGQETVSVLSGAAIFRVDTDAEILAELRAGWIGRRHLLIGEPGSPSLLDDANPLSRPDFERIASEVVQYSDVVKPHPAESELTRGFRRLEREEQAALLVLLRRLTS